jgi:molecular chaperone HtpG
MATIMQFQAEAKQLLKLVIHSLYTHKQVFLRELIANAADALEKLRFLSLTDPSVLKDSSELFIFIEIDTERRTLSISDNGIGMTYDEVIENIGKIAKSGSASLLEYLKNNTDKANLELIGQFGVGFYSAFMVADKVTLLTRAPKAELGVKWESTGDGTYEIEAVERPERGTTVTLHLKAPDPNAENQEDDFLNQYTIQKYVQQYCNFINYPILMDFATEEPERDEQGSLIEEKRHTVISRKTLNSIQPLWERDPKEISSDEYFRFYKAQFNDWNEPAKVLHFRSEGTVEFTSLLFIPSQSPYDFYTGGARTGIHLHSKRVLVMKDCQELLPEYLRFIRGIVDSTDLSLNVSRETLQHDSQLRVIGNHIEKRILDALKSLLTEDRKKYEALWDEFGKALKGGIFLNYKNVSKLQDLLLFETSYSQEHKATLQDYVERMPEQQKEIFYAVGSSRNSIERLPQMERIREKNIEVLYFLDKVDEFLTQNLQEYNGKKLRSVSRGDLDIEGIEEGQEELEKREEEYKELFELIKKSLNGKVGEVRLSRRLKSSPVCLVNTESGYSSNMERLMKESGHMMFKATRILEVNPDHLMIRILRDLVKSHSGESKLSDYCQLLYDQALLIENETVEDPVKFANTVSQLFVDAHNSLS